LERFNFIFLVAGICFFALAFAVSAVLPALPAMDLPNRRSVADLASVPPNTFLDLKDEYPEAFAKAFGDKPINEAFEEALRVGHKTYVGEACWHCHSQQIRPWGNDEAQYGRVSFPEEYNHELAMPPLWGTRRIGPDLIRRGGFHSNDWHVAHFLRPRDVNPVSVMPDYPWFYEDDGKTPNKKGLSVIAYVQWLGSWIHSNEENVFNQRAIERDSGVANVVRPVNPNPPAKVETKKDDAPAADDSGY
jgi:hypothetical protein